MTMRDENDLQGAFALLEKVADNHQAAEFSVNPDAAAPVLEFTTVSGPQRRRRRWVPIVAAAAMVCGVAVGGTALLQRDTDRTGSTAPGASPTLSSAPAPSTAPVVAPVAKPAGTGTAPTGDTRSSAPPSTATTAKPASSSAAVTAPPAPKLEAGSLIISLAGYEILGFDDFDDMDHLVVRSDSGKLVTIAAFESGGQVPTITSEVTEPVKVGKIDATFTRWFVEFGGIGPESHGVGWEYAKDAWALVISEDGATKAELMEIAQAVKIGPKAVAPSPLKFEGLPEGFVYVGAVINPGESIYNFQSAKGAGDTGFVVVVRPGEPGGVQPITGKFGEDFGSTVQVDVGGKDGYWDPKGGGIEVDFGDHVVWVDHAFGQDPGSKMLGQEVMIQIANSISLASDMNDMTTWFDSATAIPN